MITTLHRLFEQLYRQFERHLSLVVHELRHAAQRGERALDGIEERPRPPHEHHCPRAGHHADSGEREPPTVLVCGLEIAAEQAVPQHPRPDRGAEVAHEQEAPDAHAHRQTHCDGELDGEALGEILDALMTILPMVDRVSDLQGMIPAPAAKKSCSPTCECHDGNDPIKAFLSEMGLLQ